MTKKEIIAYMNKRDIPAYDVVQDDSIIGIVCGDPKAVDQYVIVGNKRNAKIVDRMTAIEFMKRHPNAKRLDDSETEEKNEVKHSDAEILRMVNEEIERRENELYHHGIQGQKWGVKHGPPYPLDRQTHNNVRKKSVKNINTKVSNDSSAGSVPFALTYISAMTAAYLIDDAYSKDKFRSDKALKEGSKKNAKIVAKKIKEAKQNKEDWEKAGLDINEVAKINANREDKRAGAYSNCGMCASMLALAMNGEDVSLVKYSKTGAMTSQMADFFNVSMDDVKTLPRMDENVRRGASDSECASQVRKNYEDYIKSNFPKGSSGIITHTMLFSNHFFNFKYTKDGEVVFLDAQNPYDDVNELFGWYEYKGKGSKFGDTYGAMDCSIIRTDNATHRDVSEIAITDGRNNRVYNSFKVSLDEKRGKVEYTNTEWRKNRSEDDTLYGLQPKDSKVNKNTTAKGINQSNKDSYISDFSKVYYYKGDQKKSEKLIDDFLKKHHTDASFTKNDRKLSEEDAKYILAAYKIYQDYGGDKKCSLDMSGDDLDAIVKWIDGNGT